MAWLVQGIGKIILIESDIIFFIAEAEMAEGEVPAEGEEPMDAEEDEIDEGEDGNEKKYVKKEYVAKDYHSEWVDKTVEEVEALSIKNSR